MRQPPETLAAVTVAVYGLEKGLRCTVSVSDLLLRQWLRWTHPAVRALPHLGEGEHGAIMRLSPSLDGGQQLYRHGARRMVHISLKSLLGSELDFLPWPHAACMAWWGVDWGASEKGHDLLVTLPESWRS